MEKDLEAWKRMNMQATTLVKSGLLPKSVNTPEKAVAIMQRGYELGLPPMEAFSHIYVVDGKPTMSAELMLSSIYRKCPGVKIVFVERNSQRCKIRATKPRREPVEFSFSIEDARRAGLTKKHNWQSYPRHMLHARCVAEMARSLFPECLSGISHTPEELGAQVELNPATGSIESVDVELIEESIPVEIYEGTGPQKLTVQAWFRNVGIYERAVMADIAVKFKGKPMGDIPNLIAKEVRKLHQNVDINEDHTLRLKALRDQYGIKVKALKDIGLTDEHCRRLAGVKDWDEIDTWTFEILNKKLKAFEGSSNDRAVENCEGEKLE